jgi:Cys-rich repeat protein
MDRIRFLALALGSGLVAASASSCSGSGNDKNGNGGSGGLIFGTGGGNNGVPCSADGDCPSGQVCHPVSGTCTTPGGSCTSNADCPQGMYCDAASSTCLTGVTGASCETDAQCEEGNTCTGGVCGCGGIAAEQELVGGALDIYMIFDRTASMGEDCDYVAGDTPPVQSKACFATYALPNYLINVPQAVDTRLAFQFMSLASAPTGCDGALYATPAFPMTQLPLTANDPIIQAISNETFAGGFGTQIEGALRGLAMYTAGNVTAGREMIGVLMTDGDPNGCEGDVGNLSQIIADHLAATGIRTFIIGMEGATDANLEQYGLAGGAEGHNDYCGSVAPPCHYWNTGNGSGDAIGAALQAIISQAAPLPCDFDVVNLTPPAGQTLDYGKVNVKLTDPAGNATLIGQVQDAAACPAGQEAWYYDNPSAPTNLQLCPGTCDLVTGAAQGSRVSVVVGCTPTIVIPLR